MSAPLPLQFYQRLLSREGESPVPVIVRITHDRLSLAVRITNDINGLDYSGYFYQGYPFKVSLPAAPDGMSPRARLNISNAGGDFIDEFEALGGFVGGSVFLGIYDPLSQVLGIKLNLNVLSAAMNDEEIALELGYESFNTLPAVALVRQPENQPGVF